MNEDHGCITIYAWKWKRMLKFNCLNPKLCTNAKTHSHGAVEGHRVSHCRFFSCYYLKWDKHKPKLQGTNSYNNQVMKFIKIREELLK